MNGILNTIREDTESKIIYECRVCAAKVFSNSNISVEFIFFLKSA